MMIWQGVMIGWHWVVSILGNIVLWCFLAAVVFCVIEFFLYRSRKRRDQS